MGDLRDAFLSVKAIAFTDNAMYTFEEEYNSTVAITIEIVPNTTQ